MDMGTVAGRVILTLQYSREGENWVGICQELSTSTFADTLEHCQQELNELVIEHLNVLEEIGQRERFFHDWGIELYPAHISPKEVVLRGDGDPSWDDLLKGVVEPSGGVFLQPRAFPIDQAKGTQALLHGT